MWCQQNNCGSQGRTISAQTANMWWDSAVVHKTIRKSNLNICSLNICKTMLKLTVSLFDARKLPMRHNWTLAVHLEADRASSLARWLKCMYRWQKMHRQIESCMQQEAHKADQRMHSSYLLKPCICWCHVSDVMCLLQASQKDRSQLPCSCASTAGIFTRKQFHALCFRHHWKRSCDMWSVDHPQEGHSHDASLRSKLGGLPKTEQVTLLANCHVPLRIYLRWSPLILFFGHAAYILLGSMSLHVTSA